MSPDDASPLNRIQPDAPAPERAPTPDPLLARPVEGEPDWMAIFEQVERDFPKTLARLAE